MSGVSQVTAVVPVVEPGVEEFVKQRGIEGPFRAMLRKTPELFPTARLIRVSVEPDPEIADYWFLTFEVRVALADVLDRRAAERRWGDEYFRSYPPPIGQGITLDLIREES